ncbi:hypothetical protein GLU64_01050 [Nanohaloarchaea archaeon]|nr:hypothetical protein [Candidatus Nanohaloarchaea archaeon]
MTVEDLLDDQFYDLSPADIEDDLLEEYIPDSIEHLESIGVGYSREALAGDSKLSRYITDAASNYLMEQWRNGVSTDEAYDDLQSSELFKSEISGPVSLSRHLIKRESAIEYDGDIFTIINDSFQVQKVYEKYRKEMGHTMAPTNHELEQYALRNTEANFAHGIHDEPEIKDIDVEKVRDYVDFVRAFYDEEWGSAPRGRGIGGEGLPENQKALINEENPVKGKIVDVARKVAPGKVDEMLYNTARSGLDSGSKLKMRPTQQWSTDPKYFLGYGRGVGDGKNGLVIIESDTDTLLSTGLVGVGHSSELEAMSDSTREFDSDRVFLPKEFDPVKFARWSLGNLKTTDIEPRFE